MTDDRDVAGWIAAGLYDPAAPDAADQLDLLRYLTEKGATTADMVAARDRRALTAAASDRLTNPVRTLTRDEAVTRSGLTSEQLDRAWLSLGLPPAPEAGPAFAEGDLPLLQAFALGIDLLGFEAALQFTRVMGSSLARIADAAVSGFLFNVEGPLVDQHSTPVALARASYEASVVLASLPQVFAPIFFRHAELATIRSRTTRAGASYAEFSLSVGFVDLVGYTAWSRDLSSVDLALAVNDFEEAASDAIVRHGARVVKNIGDAVMLIATDERVVTEVALELCQYVDEHPTLTRLRGAVASGALLSRDGDYFGPTVNLAARAVKVAEPGQVVADRAIPGFTSRSLGPREVRGIDDPVELFVITR